MSFSEEMQKRLLPNAEFFIKSVESRYNEPLKQAMAYEKEIRTLLNPRNLNRASKQSAGAYTQLLRFYEQEQGKSKTERLKIKNDMNARLDGVATERSDAYKEITDSVKIEINKRIDELRQKSVAVDKVTTNFKTFIKDVKLKEGSLASLLAVQDVLDGLDDMPEKRQEVQKWAAENIIKKLDPSLTNVDARNIDVKEFIQRKYPDLSQSPEGIANRERILNPQNSAERTQYEKDFFDDIDFSTFSDFSPEIKMLKSVVFGGELPEVSSTGQLSEEQQLKLVDGIPGLTVAEGRVIVDPESSSTAQEGAQKFLETTGSKNPKIEEFVSSPPIVKMLSGNETGSSSVRKMQIRAAELEERKNQLLEIAADANRLTVAEQSVLTNPLFTRTGFRRTPRYGLLEKAAALKESPELTADEDPIVDEDPVVGEPEVEEASVTDAGTSGVPVVPAIINRFQKAYAKAGQTGDYTELKDLIEDFQALPMELQESFPGQFTSAVYMYGKRDQKGGDEGEYVAFGDAIKRLDDAAVTTKTVAQYVSNVSTEMNQDELIGTSAILDIVNHPDSFGEGGDRDRLNPLGSFGAEFQQTLINIAANEAGKEDLEAVIEQSRSASQKERPEFYERELYGNYKSIDDFVAKMDDGSGPPSEAPDTTTEPEKREIPNPFEGRKRRKFDRIAKEYDEKLKSGADDKAFADSVLQEDADFERDESEINRQAIATATRGSESSLRSPRDVQLAAAADKVAQEEDSAAIIAAEDAERKARSERPAITGTDDTKADRVLRESFATTPAPTVGKPPSDDQEVSTDKAPDLVEEPPKVDEAAPEPSPKDQMVQALPEARDGRVVSSSGRIKQGTPIVDAITGERYNLQNVYNEDGTQTYPLPVTQEGSKDPFAPIEMVPPKATPSEKPEPSEPARMTKDRAIQVAQFLAQQVENGEMSIDLANQNIKTIAEQADLSEAEQVDVFDGLRLSIQNKEQAIAKVRAAQADRRSKRITKRPVAAPEPPKPEPVVEEPKGPPRASTQPERRPTSFGKLTPMDNARIIRNEFQKRGYSDNQIAAIMANAISESSLNPLAKNPGTKETPEMSYGLFQFNQMGGEGEGIDASMLKDPFYQIDAVDNAIKSRDELAFFKDNPDSDAKDLSVSFMQNFIKPKDFDKEFKMEERRKSVSSAEKYLNDLKLDDEQNEVLKSGL
jgi:hypothetical protein